MGKSRGVGREEVTAIRIYEKRRRRKKEEGGEGGKEEETQRPAEEANKVHKAVL